MTLLVALLTLQQGEVIWSRPDTGGVYNAIATQDIDQDGTRDVLTAIYYGAIPSPQVRLYCHSGRTGTELWSQANCQGVWGNKSLASIRDVTGDSVRDVLLGTPGGVAPGSSVFLKSGVDGGTRWTWCTYTQGPNWGWIYAVREFIDLTHDGFPEVLAAAGGNANDRSGTAFCFNGFSGETLWTFRVPRDGAQCIAVIDDFNQDSVPEVAVGGGGNGLDNRVYLLDGRTGQQRWSYDLGGSVSTVARISDVDGSGAAEVVAGSWNHNVACIDGATGKLIWDVTPSSYIVMEVVPIRDINRDSIDDVVVGSWASSVFVLSGRNGSIIWTQAVGQDCWMVDTLADITGDNIPEVVVGALNGKTVAVFDGALQTLLWSYPFAERIYDVTGAPDLDGDGFADVLVGLQDQGHEQDHVFAFKGLPNTAISDSIPTRTDRNWQLWLAQGEVLVSGKVGSNFTLSILDPAGKVEARLFRGRLHKETIPIRLDQHTFGHGAHFLLLQSPLGQTSLKLPVLH